MSARTLVQLDDNLAAGDLDLSEDETRLLDMASDPGAPDYPYGERDQTQRHAVQNKALLGLTLLLVEVLLLGTLAMVGTAAHWFPEDFALQVLAITLAPSFSAWVIVLRWAFQRARRD